MREAGNERRLDAGGDPLSSGSNRDLLLVTTITLPRFLSVFEEIVVADRVGKYHERGHCHLMSFARSMAALSTAGRLCLRPLAGGSPAAPLCGD